jgi:hypothetical protein
MSEKNGHLNGANLPLKGVVESASVERRRVVVARYLNGNYSLEWIADKVCASLAEVSEDARVLTERWRGMAVRAVDQAKGESLAYLAGIKEKCEQEWEAWERWEKGKLKPVGKGSLIKAMLAVDREVRETYGITTKYGSGKVGTSVRVDVALAVVEAGKRLEQQMVKRVEVEGNQIEDKT